MNERGPTRMVRLLVWPVVAFYGLLWAGGVIAYVFLGGPPAGTAWTAPAFLSTAAVLALMATPHAEWAGLFSAAAIGLAAEWLGVATGVPFGPYSYTGALFPRVAGVPLVMGAAWLVLFAYVRQMTRSPWAAAARMTAIDLVIDPLAANVLDFWRWERPGPYYGIPWSNFAGWFAVSFVLFALVRRPAAPRSTVRWLGLSVVLFFTAIAFGARLYGAGLAGLAMVSLHWARSRPASGRSARSTASVPPDTPGR